ncbi:MULTISPECIES: hypothetical protein [Stenotrophomonas]|uniref:hypothetical protein n=1 Tax=Stenotrophomonas TaxID=40323 RepID=UPI0015DDBBF5|nr:MULTISPECIES: hypothetical protein [Stenotrophomonas]MBA0333184.1 DNA-binding protein [Stenotrophomonas maltophilia]MCU1010601.1 hypothetical protein [Stenotrophomonas maltophilia]MDH7618638.1 hypothetical protein [Stenotrophomonas maltophilia]MDV3511765.1 hypothetical protein [Stenotrophomonas sp. C4297]MEA1826712.1 hypothetical protein [Stenotrophomonas maltophilia]
MDELPAALPLEQQIALLRQQLTTLRIDLSGKDWLTAEEAAHYCGVSVSQFNARAHEYDLHPRKFMGKKLYEKSALYQAIYGAKAWTRPSATSAPTLAATSPEMKEALARLRRYDDRKGKR